MYSYTLLFSVLSFPSFFIFPDLFFRFFCCFLYARAYS